jgi:hypothetical protein
MEVKYLELYNSFLNELSQLNLVNNEVIDNLINETDEKKIKNGTQLVLSIDNAVNFNYLLNSKIKLFSHKNPDTMHISEVLFGKNLSLKKIFNNQSDEVKNQFWFYIHNIVYYISKIHFDNEKSADYIDKLEVLINTSTVKNKSILDTKKYINKIINNENLNSTTNEMIDDIVKSFENAFSDGTNNPFQNIMQINDVITNKYKDKIDSGEIDLNQIMESLQKSVPGLGDMNGLGDILSSFTSTNTEPKETVIMDENFSTADINQGTLESDKPNMVIGNVLKTVSSLSSNFIDNTVGDNQESNDENTSNTGPDLSKLMGIFNKLGSLQGSNPEDLQNIFENELGLDMNKLTEQMTKVLGNNKL